MKSGRLFGGRRWRRTQTRAVMPCNFAMSRAPTRCSAAGRLAWTARPLPRRAPRSSGSEPHAGSLASLGLLSPRPSRRRLGRCRLAPKREAWACFRRAGPSCALAKLPIDSWTPSRASENTVNSRGSPLSPCTVAQDVLSATALDLTSIRWPVQQSRPPMYRATLDSATPAVSHPAPYGLAPGPLCLSSVVCYFLLQDCFEVYKQHAISVNVARPCRSCPVLAALFGGGRVSRRFALFRSSAAAAVVATCGGRQLGLSKSPVCSFCGLRVGRHATWPCERFLGFSWMR